MKEAVESGEVCRERSRASTLLTFYVIPRFGGKSRVLGKKAQNSGKPRMMERLRIDVQEGKLYENCPMDG